ncbi:Biopolymer transport protein ExbB [Sporomusa silvacetica DSM 10669]|uniref:Biopolymer transport protein ExbB n=1 Tax=Sporomusa silvacetica DSM 10669 TaxID=1123289 RepID=A0ABZ3II29_9FIRM|nr:MotA/TolQ/ExbB proton channel family protein [Sporomusa silvacetica]OZC14859.1 biopolymer transport protein ExbB [Sporomusa silvacetica DSM 10669]
MVDLLIKGGWIMLPLAICSIVAITIIVERLLFFKRAGAVERADKVITLINQGQIDEAINLTKGAKVPLLRILSAGIDNRHKSAKAMEAVGIAELSVMRRGLPALDTIITLSPLLGLLGTIIGMINSFQVMAVASMGQPHAVTGGVAEALIATATGITVAVVTLIPYNYFLARVERETEVIEHYATKLEIALDTLPYRSDKYEDTKKYA